MITRFQPLIMIVACLFSGFTALAQETAAFRGMTPEEYKMAVDIEVADLDNDTYVKVKDGQYVLDRYEMKPPYAITGDSGIKKRIDLYRLMERESMQELGMLAFFTNTEDNSTFNLVIPSVMSGAEVWNMYFDDIHQHDREEKDVALKMSYVLSKEVAYLMQKSSGADMGSMEQTNADYDFCFPAATLVTLPDGQQKPISEIKVKDEIMAYRHGQLIRTTVQEVSIHRAEQITLSRVLLVPEAMVTADLGQKTYQADVQELIATPNHPVLTAQGKTAVEALLPGDVLFYYNPMTRTFDPYRVHLVQSYHSATDEVYNLVTQQGNFIANGMVVSEK